MALMPVGNLSEDPVKAAQQFYSSTLPKIEADAIDSRVEREDVLLQFQSAGHDHRNWRLAAVQDLARKLSPRRVNAIESDQASATQVAEVSRYLANAPGVTGQILSVGANLIEKD